MIYFVCALYQEAEPFINRLCLKKSNAITHFQVFSSEEVKLIISGTGSISAAIATTYLCTQFPPDKHSFLVNIGLAGASDYKLPISELCIVNKIVDASTNRTYYPDMIFRHNFTEMCVVTYPKFIENNPIFTQPFLVDMEASGIYLSARMFFQTHQMIFFKIVSDHLEKKDISSFNVPSIMDSSIEIILSWIQAIHTDSYHCEASTDEIYQFTCEIIDNLKLSVSNQHQFKQYIHYYRLQHNDLDSVLSQMSHVCKQCKSKREGKQYFEKFKQQLLQ